ncbi:MAG: hypothetical protein CK429_05715 [Mycobacterium sp.]|nr:MAG: hypothetical protein CK429_05715 [Mycobacterium sp.]
MADGARPALGLSIGATNLAAVTPDHAITRKPVLTLYRQRPPEVGVPSENPRLDEPGLVITDFVDRVGDRVGIVAADGSVHRSEALVADGLRALAYAATGGRALPDNVAVTYPAHWAPAAVDALGGAVSRVSEWSHQATPVTLIPDAAAALFAVRANPGIPARGTVAVCDFGGSGTSITLVDASADYQPLGPTVRHHDFSGDLVDQSLLSYVMSEMPGTGSFDPSATAAIGSLNRLRAACRAAKERLSATTVTTLSEAVPGLRGEIRLTRNELEETIRGSLDGVVGVLEESLRRNASGLVAIVTVGGGANIPAVTTSLSGRFGVPVITTPRPQLTAAIGGALRAARGPGDTSATTLTPAAPPPVAPPAPEPSAEEYQDVPAAAPVSAMQPALAWSEAQDESRLMPALASDSGSGSGSGYTAARPQMKFEREERPEPEPKASPIPWYRLPAVIIISTVVAVLLVGTAVAIGLTSHEKGSKSPGVNTTPRSSAPPPATSESPSPEPPPASTPEPAPTTQAPAPRPQTQAPAPVQTTQAPPPTTEAPAPATTTVPPPATTTQPPVTTAPPVPQVPQLPGPANPNPPAPPPIPQIPQIPGLPQLPGIANVPAVPAVPGRLQAG